MERRELDQDKDQNKKNIEEKGDQKRQKDRSIDR